MERCWEQDPANRPTARDIVEYLEPLVSASKPKSRKRPFLRRRSADTISLSESTKTESTYVNSQVQNQIGLTCQRTSTRQSSKPDAGRLSRSVRKAAQLDAVDGVLNKASAKLRDLDAKHKSRSTKPTEPAQKPRSEVKTTPVPHTSRQVTTQGGTVRSPGILVTWNTRRPFRAPDSPPRNEIRPGESTINPFEPCEPFPAAPRNFIRRAIPMVLQQPTKRFALEGSSTIDPFEPCEPFDTSHPANQFGPYRITPGLIAGIQHACPGTCFITGAQSWCPSHAIRPTADITPFANVTLTRLPFFYAQ